MDPWIEEMQTEVYDIIKDEVKNWGSIVNILVTGNEDRKEWVDNFKQQTQEFFGDLIKDIADTQEKLFCNIEVLLEKASRLCKQLGIKMPSYGTSNMGLYNEEAELRKRIQELENEVSKRVATLQDIKNRQNVACEVLGRTAIKIVENPLPTKEQLEEVIQHVMNMEEEIEARKEKYTFLKNEIILIAEEIQAEPCLDFEKLVIYGDTESFQVTDINMDMLEQFRVDLLEKAESAKSEILILREKIKSLWEILSMDMYECDQFLENVKGNSLGSVEILKNEVKRCDELKKANLEVFIKKIRSEIEKYWEKCFFAEEQRNEFEYFHDDLYTEDLLTLHDMQLEKLKKYYETNKDLIDLIVSYEKLWNKLYDLDKRALLPNRYKNRGGQLLKEEKERNAVEKNIPIVEEKMLSLSAEYELKNGKPFLYKGEWLEAKINKFQENYEQEKKSKLNAFKQKRDTSTLVQSKATCSSMTNLTRAGTPMKLGVSTFRTPAKRNALTPKFSENKRFKLSEKKTYGTRTAPSKIQVSKNIPKIQINPATPKNVSLNSSTNKRKNRVKLTFSTEKKKKQTRRSKRLSKQINLISPKNLPQVVDPIYNNFEAELSSKQPTCRSTLFEPTKSHKVTPQKSIVKLEDRKLKTAPNFNMEF